MIGAIAGLVGQVGSSAASTAATAMTSAEDARRKLEDAHNAVQKSQREGQNNLINSFISTMGGIRY